MHLTTLVHTLHNGVTDMMAMMYFAEHIIYSDSNHFIK
jgi:hypothetical protein